MTTGSPADILARVKKLIPKGWFKWVAPYRDALIGGLTDSAAWNYTLVAYAKAQTRLSTAYGVWLDVFAYDFLGLFLVRNKLPDDTFRVIIRATILQERVTRASMIASIKALTGYAPMVFEPWNTFDTGAYSGADGIKYSTFGYNIGQGGYGNMNLPGQTFIQVTRGSTSGVPGVDGWGGTIGAYGAGAIEYVSQLTPLAGVTNDIIYNMINTTKPTGTTCWIAFDNPAVVLTTDAGVTLTNDVGVTLANR